MTPTTTKEHPIIFSGEMVRAILAGRKRQTRRMAKCLLPGGKNYTNAASHDEWLRKRVAQCPYGVVGNRLWVRETWRETFDPYQTRVIEYKSGGSRLTDGKSVFHGKHACTSYLPAWRPSIYMPRYISRLALTITGIRIERLQAISEKDAKAEGCERHYCSPEDTATCKPGTPERALAERFEGGYLTAKNQFINLWDSINGKRCPWSSNPWVWVVGFAVEKGGAKCPK